MAKVWRHRKRGSRYIELGRAEVQTSRPILERETVVIYQGEDGRLWARPDWEFDDGRFEEVSDD